MSRLIAVFVIFSFLSATQFSNVKIFFFFFFSFLKLKLIHNQNTSLKKRGRLAE